MPLSRDPQLDPSDIKLLRVFLKVVECGGFSGAQAELNVSAATISRQMATLESRLGMRLCDRGRVGFRLTDKGQRVRTAAERLEEAISAFRSDIGELRGMLVGELQLGVVDSTVTNPDAKLHDAISRFTRRDNAVHITLHVSEPGSIEKQLLDCRINIGISAFYHHVPGLAYEHLYFEQQGLYCGRNHPFYARGPDSLSVEEVRASDYITRGYMIHRQQGSLARLKSAATAYDMEATLTMIRSGAYIGHLPRHYAEALGAGGELQEILPEQFRFASDFELAYRRGASELRLVRTFLEDLRSAQGTTATAACSHE